MSRYYTPAEVAVHNTHTDCWVSFLGKVFDLTRLVAENEGILTQPIVVEAGKDISHWFDPATEDVRTYADPVTGTPSYYTPQGRFIHVLPNTPVADQVTVVTTPWWMDPQYQIGMLSLNVRPIKLSNTLTYQEHFLEVPGEETMNEILERYLAFNAHAASYTWKHLGRVLDMNLTMEENGVLDEREDYAKLNLPDDFFVPLLHLYFNDDLTEA